MLIKNQHKQKFKRRAMVFHNIDNRIFDNSELMFEFLIFNYNKLNSGMAFLLIMLILSALPIASAFGATAPYWKDQPLIMSPGETRTFPIILQNMVGGKDITLKGEITSGSEIAVFIGKNSTYSVPFGKEDIKANLKIEIPQNAKKGDKYAVTVFFKQISETEGKMLQISGGITASFLVIVKKEISESPQQKTESSSKYFLYIITIIIVLIISTIIALFLLIKKVLAYRSQNPSGFNLGLKTSTRKS